MQNRTGVQESDTDRDDDVEKVNSDQESERPARRYGDFVETDEDETADDPVLDQDDDDDDDGGDAGGEGDSDDDDGGDADDDDADDDADEKDEDEDEEEDDEDEKPVEPAKLLGRVPDKEWHSLPKATQKRINALRASHKTLTKQVEAFESEPVVVVGRSVQSFLDENNLDENSLNTWLRLGATVNKGGQAAIDALLETAKAFGYKGEATSGTSGTLPDWLQDKVDAGEVDEAAAQEIMKHMGPSEPPQGRTADDPMEQAIRQGQQVLASRRKAAEKQYGTRWKKLFPLVQREMLRNKGSHPEAWGPLFDTAVRLAVAELKPKKKAKAPASLPPGRSSKPTDPGELTGRARIHAKYSR